MAKKIFEMPPREGEIAPIGVPSDFKKVFEMPPKDKVIPEVPKIEPPKVEPPEEKEAWWIAAPKAFRKGVEVALLNIPKAVVSGIRMIFEPPKEPEWEKAIERRLPFLKDLDTGFEKLLRQPITDWSIDVIGGFTQKQRDIVRPILDDKPGLSSLEEYIFTATTGTVSLFEAVGATIVTKSPTAGAAFLSVLELTDEYNQARDAGVSVNKARVTATASGIGTFILEKVGLDYLFSLSGGNWIMRGLKGMAFETLQEETQTVWQNLVRKVSYKPAEKIFEGWWETAVGIAPASFLAGIVLPMFNVNIRRSQFIKDIMDKTGVSKEKANKVVDEMVDRVKVEKETFATQTKEQQDKLTKELGVETPAMKAEDFGVESEMAKIEGGFEEAQPIRTRKPEAPLISIYLSKKTEVEKALGEIWMEMDMAKKGERFRTPEGEWIGKTSSFPEWIPKHLRVKGLFDSLVHDITTIEGLSYPKSQRQRELFNAILDRVDEKTDLDTTNLRSKIIDNYEKIYDVTKTKEDFGRSIAGKVQRGEAITPKEVKEEMKRIAPLIEKVSFAEAIKGLSESQKVRMEELRIALTRTPVRVKGAISPEAIYETDKTLEYEGTEEITPEKEEINKITDKYFKAPLSQLSKIPITIRETKFKFIDSIGGQFFRWYGTDIEAKRLLVKMLGSQDLVTEDIIELMTKLFPVSSEDAELLLYNREQPEKYPIPPELTEYAERVDSLLELTKTETAKRKLLHEYFPQSFIKKAQHDINQEKAIISTLVTEGAIQKHLSRIEMLEQYIDFLKTIKYVPHIYQETIERNIVHLLPEGTVTRKFRSALSKLKGRKIDTLDKAKELGLVPETDVRVVLAQHLEYVFRKIAIYDTIESLKKNETVVLKDADAPTDWGVVAISQLSGYRVHPTLVRALEDFVVNPKTNYIMKGYDAVNYLGKALVFYNPIILPFWDIFQAYGAGSITPWKPLYSGSLVIQGWKEVLGQGEVYKQCVQRNVYTTPKVGYFSPPVEESMRVVVHQMDKKYPQWKKSLEKIMHQEVKWNTFMPWKIIYPTLYHQNWRLTWALDRVLRTATVIHAQNAGMNINEAAEYAVNFHANYNLFTKKTKKWMNRLFLVPTYKANMLVNLPTQIVKNSASLAKKVATGKSTTAMEREYFKSSFRIMLLMAGILAFAGWRKYHLREGYRLVKKLEEPEVTKEGRVLREKVITLPGPFFEWPKLIKRLANFKDLGIYMYLAKVPQMAVGVLRNRRWEGSPYWDEGAAKEVQTRQLIVSLLTDYVAPMDRIHMLTKEELDAFDHLLSNIGIATYKRGSTEERIFWQIKEVKAKALKYIKRPDISAKEREAAVRQYESDVMKLIDELSDYVETYK